MPTKGKQRTNLQALIQFQERVLTPSSWINQADELVQASKKLEPSIKKHWLTVSKYFDPNKGTYNPPPEFKPKRLLQATYFMLVAYAIENYFKAILVAENGEKYRQEILRIRKGLREGKLPEDLKKDGHDLIKLITKMKSNFDLTEAELSLLTRLFRHSVWKGRYPVPIKADELINSTASYDGQRFDIKAIGQWPGDIDDLKILIRRIRKFSTNKALSPEERRYLVAYA